MLYKQLLVLLLLFFFALVGSRLYYILFHDSIWFLSGATGSSGGWIGGLVGVYLITFLFKINIWKFLDSITVPLMLGIAIGRVGCFYNGCCYPTQLIEATYALILAILSIHLLRQSIYNGKIFLAIMILYPFGRILIEFFRRDNIVFLWGFSLPQYIYAMIFLIGVYFLIIKKRDLL